MYFVFKFGFDCVKFLSHSQYLTEKYERSCNIQVSDHEALSTKKKQNSENDEDYHIFNVQICFE